MCSLTLFYGDGWTAPHNRRKTAMDHKALIALNLEYAAQYAANAEAWRAALATSVAYGHEDEIASRTAFVELWTAMEAKHRANAEKHARLLAEEDAAEAVSDEGVVLVQPETVAVTLDRLDDLIAELRTEAEAVANLDGGEWTIRQHIDALHLGKGLLLQAVEMGDASMAQGLIATFEEVEA